MGWWETADGAVIGDEPADIVDEMLEKVTRAYEQDLYRKPSVREIEETLGFVISAHIDELANGVEEVDVVGLTIRLRKRPKKRKIRLGDFFAVPLPSGGYGFGRVKRWGPGIVLVDFLDAYSTSLLDVSKLLGLGTVLGLLCADYQLVDRKWPVLGHVPLRGVPPEGGPRDEMWDFVSEGVTIYGPDNVARHVEDVLRERGRVS